MTRRASIRAPRGFSLLEVMIAVAILSASLTWLVVGISRNIRAENHAKLMTTATFLVRGKMSSFEDELYDKGFGEFEKEVTGAFDDKGFARFTWRVIVDKVELPNNEQLQTMLTKAQDIKQATADPNAPQPPPPPSNSSANSPITSSAGMLASQFGLIKDVLEQGIRRVTVEVRWLEGRAPQNVSVVAYFTDPRKVDQAIQMSLPSQGGQNGKGGTSTSTPGSTPGSTPTTTPSVRPPGG